MSTIIPSIPAEPGADARTVVVALGGNALSRRGEPATAENLRKNVREAVQPLAEVALKERLILTHGNGPQVGLLALQNLAYQDVQSYPLDILGAESQGMLGYVIGQEMRSAARMRRDVVTVLTTTVVDPEDEAFASPEKFVGPVYEEQEAHRLAEAHGWQVRPDGKWWRRVVPSPRPLGVQQASVVRSLSAQGCIVLCAGGGGVPVVEDPITGRVIGVEGVVDKDRATAVLAQDVAADLLLLLTDADAVYLDWGTPTQRAIRQATPEQLSPFAFPAGSMGPKVEAACRFVERTGATAVIGSADRVQDILAGRSGTWIVSDGELLMESPQDRAAARDGEIVPDQAISGARASSSARI